MAYSKIKGITIEIGGDTTKLGEALESVNKKSIDLQKELSGVNKLLKFDPSNITLLKQKQDLLTSSISSTEEKLKKLKEAQKSVNEQFEKGEITEEQYRDFQREIAATEEKLKKLKDQMKDFGSVSQQVLENIANKVTGVGDKLESAGKKISAVSAIAGTALGASAKTAIDFESAFAGVEKTVDGTTEQLETLKQGIRDMAKEIPSSTTEIAEVAEAAGQLGIKTDDILSFTKVMIDLGNSTNISASEAASSLAKFANITNMNASEYDRLGAVIVDLGNHFATTESDIVSMGTKLAATGELTGLSQAQIMALATAMSSVGIEAEAGGSAMSKLLKKIQLATETGSDALADFASVSGMTSQEFKKAFEDDAVSALSAFISGLNDTERNGKTAIQILDDMGLTEVRLSNTILSLANSGDLLSSAVDLGNDAWENNSALVNEANKRYNTTQSKMTISTNKIKDLGITLGSKLLPNIVTILEKINNLTDKFDSLDDNTKNMILTIGTLAAALSPILISGGKIIKGTGTIISTVGKITSVLSPATVVIAGLAAAIALVATNASDASRNSDEYSIATQKLADEQEKLNETLAKNKEARQEAINEAETEVGTADILYNKLVELEGVENKSNAQKEIMAQLVNELNGIMPDLNLEYDKEQDALNQTTDAIKNQIDAQKELIKAKAAQEQLTSVASDIVDQELELAKVEEQHALNVKNLEDAKRKLAEFEETYGTDVLKMNSEQRLGYKLLIDQVEKANGTCVESNLLLGEQKQAIADLNQEYADIEGYVEKAFNTADISKRLGTITEIAKTAGIDIPTSLAEGMQEGSIAIPESLEGLENLINFETALKNANLAGVQIPLSISEGLTNGEMTVENAVLEMQKVVEFNKLLEEAEKAGKDIPKNLAENMMNGKVSIDDAISQIKSSVDFTEVAIKAEADGLIIPKNLAIGVERGDIEVEEANQIINDSITFKETLEKATTAGIEIPKNLTEGIINSELSVTEANDIMNTWIDFNAANQESIEAGMDIPYRIKEGILSGELSITEANTKMNSWIEFKQSIEKAKVAGVSITDELVENVGNGKVNVQTATENLTTAIREALKGTEQIGIDAGGNLIKGTAAGINSKNNQNSVFSALSKFGTNMLSTLKNSLDEHSPSKASEEDSKFLLKGLEVGIDKNKKNVLNKISDFGKDVLTSLKNELNDDVALNTEFNGTRNLMMNALTNTNSSVSATSTAKDLDRVTAMLDKYMPKIIEKLGYDIILDGKKVSQTIASEMNNQLGIIAAKEKKDIRKSGGK